MTNTIECPTCRGEGIVTDRAARRPTSTRMCWTCHGDGTVNPNKVVPSP